MGFQNTIITCVLHLEEGACTATFEHLMLSEEKSVMVRYCDYQKRPPRAGHMDIADGTLRIDQPAEEVIAYRGTFTETLFPTTDGHYLFNQKLGLSNFSPLARELFHMVLPPYFLPHLASLQPWPDYGWAAGDRFAMGWLDQPNMHFRLEFAQQDPAAFASLALACRQQIKKKQPEDKPSVVGEEALTIPRIPWEEINRARDQISRGNLELGFQLLLDRERLLKAIHRNDELRLLMSQHHTLMRERAQQSEEDFQAQRNRITRALFQLLSDLESYYER